jgi:hypothetical protein
MSETSTAMRQRWVGAVDASSVELVCGIESEVEVANPAFCPLAAALANGRIVALYSRFHLAARFAAITSITCECEGGSKFSGTKFIGPAIARPKAA